MLTLPLSGRRLDRIRTAGVVLGADVGGGVEVGVLRLRSGSVMSVMSVKIERVDLVRALSASI